MSRSKKRKEDKTVSVPASLREDVSHYERLLGFNEALQLLVRRDKLRTKLDKKKAKDRVEGQAASRPDGRLNAFNLASGSLVAVYGGKRKPKRTKRGY